MSYHPYKEEELSRARQILVQELDSGPLRYMKRKLQSSKDNKQFTNIWEGEDGLMTRVCGNFPMPKRKYEEPSILESNTKEDASRSEEKDVLTLGVSSDVPSDSIKVKSDYTKLEPIEISEDSDCEIVTSDCETVTADSEIVAFADTEISSGGMGSNVDSGHNMPCAKSLPGQNTLKRTVSPVQMSDITENDVILAFSEQSSEDPILSQSSAVVHTQVTESERNEYLHINSNNEKIKTNSFNANKKEKNSIMAFHEQPKEKKSGINHKELLKNIVDIRTKLKNISAVFKTGDKKIYKMSCKMMANICYRIEGYKQRLESDRHTSQKSKPWRSAMTQLSNVRHQFQNLYTNRIDIIARYNANCVKNVEIVKIPDVISLKKVNAVGVISPIMAEDIT